MILLLIFLLILLVWRVSSRQPVKAWSKDNPRTQDLGCLWTIGQQESASNDCCRGPSRGCVHRWTSAGNPPKKSHFALQPIMPLDLPVKVRSWELTVYPRSHIRRWLGVTRPAKARM